jgi:putative ABC transport system substrate-binding protein
MKRRDFITLLGGAASWPLAARAQQAASMRRVAVLLPVTADDPDFQARVGAFLQGLQEAGWSIGRNLRIDTRSRSVAIRSVGASSRAWRGRVAMPLDS